jgi:hypothetical protein
MTQIGKTAAIIMFILSPLIVPIVIGSRISRIGREDVINEEPEDE